MKKSRGEGREEKEQALVQNSLLFQNFSKEELKDALAAMKAKKESFKKEEIIFHSGERTSRFGLVLSGSVRIESNDFWGNRTVLSMVGPRDFFAEAFAILAKEVLTVDVQASEDASILVMDLSCLNQMDDPPLLWKVKVLQNLLMISVHKNLALSRRSFQISPKTARGRVMAFLNFYAVKTRKKEFDIPFDRQEMADYLNLDRSALSKELGKMRAEGLICFHKNHFVMIHEGTFL